NNTALNTTDGGFTVFGKATTTGLAILNKLAAVPSNHTGDNRFGDPSNLNDTRNVFKEIPLKNYPSSGHGFTATLDSSNQPTGSFTIDATRRRNFDLVKQVKILRRDEVLHYTIVSNSNPDLVTVSIDSRQPDRLVLHYATGMTGTATIKVKATDRFGAS